MKLFYSCSSHIFNQSRISPQNEKTEANFNSNYGLIKYLGKEICDFYRERKEVFCTVGILYNHVSKLLKGEFLIKQLIAKIKNSHNKYLADLVDDFLIFYSKFLCLGVREWSQWVRLAI